MEFNNYLKRLGYKFKNENNELGGYIYFNDKKIDLVMDVGSTPSMDFTKNYQSGALSFEILSTSRLIFFIMFLGILIIAIFGPKGLSTFINIIFL